MTRLRAGELRHRIALDRPTVVQDPVTGDLTKGWEEVAQVWAQITASSARERIAAQAAQSSVAGRIVIRHRPDIDASWRVRELATGRLFDIEGVIPDPDSRREWLTLPYSQGANDGGL